MKKEIKSTIKARLLLGGFCSLLLAALCVFPLAPAQRAQQPEQDPSTRTSDVEIPPAKLREMQKQQAPEPKGAVCSLPGILGTAPPGGQTGNLTNRLFRPGSPTSTCSGVTYPGNLGGGPFIYNTHNITNPTGSPLCTTVTLTVDVQGTATTNMQASAFMFPFSPPDVLNSGRFLGDAGVSTGNPPVPTSFQLTVPAMTTISLVVFNVNASPAGLGTQYHITLDQPAFCGPPAPNPQPAGADLVNESCPPSNGAVDPGETVTMTLRIVNNGSAATTNLVATLQPSANVLAPSGPQSYGAIAPTQTVGRDFTFTADGNCGDTITLTLQLQDGSTNLGNITYSVLLGQQVVNTVLSENFDGVIAPALPAGWTSTASGVSGTPWVTSTTTPFSAPNDAFANDPSNIADELLVTPTLAIPAGGARLTFKNNYITESTFDGMVLEISINGGAFQDITTGGNAFIAGGYNATISTAFGSPIAGRQAWSGNSGGYIDSTINMPAAANGQNVQLRWRMASDNSVAATGVRIDNIVISNTTVVCNTACAGAPRISVSSTLSCSGSNKVATITLCNSGTATANSVTLTTAALGGVSGTPLPQSVGTLTPGACATRTVTFSGAPSGATTLQVGGTYTGGSFNSSRKVTAPVCP